MFDYPGHRTILCIDEDDGILRRQKALFERRGYKVLTTASAREGLRIAAVCEVAAVVVDYYMPEMNGLEFATEIKRLKPQMPIVVVSSDDATPEPVLNVVDAFVSKNDAARRLLPVITRICGENSRSKKLESAPERGCVGAQRGSPYLPDGMEYSSTPPSPVAGERTSLWGDSEQEIPSL